MLKRLAIFALLFYAMVSCAGQEKARPSLPQDHNNKQVAPAISPVHNEAPVPNKQSANTEVPPWWESPEWWLCILGVPTLIALFWQAQQTKLAAVATKTAADAAFKNAQAVINAERAWLLFTVEKERVQGLVGPSIFHINVVNYGKVPARRLEISRPIHATMTLNDFVSLSPPDYGDDLQEIQEWLAPKESWRVATFFPYEKRTERVMAAQNRGVELDMIEVIIYGQVTYYDGISPDVRHSRYCLAHDKEPFSNIGGSLTPVGNEEYLECT
jgi:hypothetical protein